MIKPKRKRGVPFQFDEFDHQHYDPPCCPRCVVDGWLMVVRRNTRKYYGFSDKFGKFLDRFSTCVQCTSIHRNVHHAWWEIVDGKRELKESATREVCHNEPLQNTHAGLPSFESGYSLKDDQSQRKARTGTLYPAPFKPLPVAKAKPLAERECNITYAESSLIYAWFPPKQEEKSRRFSGHLTREEMKRVLMTKAALGTITEHVSKMLHVYSKQQSGDDHSKWSKQEMDDMAMSFVVGRPRGTDVNGNQQQPSGLYALLERIDLDGRKHTGVVKTDKNGVRHHEREEPFRYEGNGGIDGFILVAAKWIAGTCKERELWRNFRNIQMVRDSKLEVIEEGVIEGEVIAGPDRRTVTRYGMFEEEVSETLEEENAYDKAANEGPDRRMIGSTGATQWEYVRSDEPLPFYKETLRFTGRKLIDVPWWER